MPLTLFIFALIAYLIGSLSFAVIVSRGLKMADPRTYGSNNPGATNVLRSGNKMAAALTLLGDGVKGWLAVFLAISFAPSYGLDERAIALVGIMVLIGHMWPVFFGFKGGEGRRNGFGCFVGAECLFGFLCFICVVVLRLGFENLFFGRRDCLCLYAFYGLVFVGF